MFDKLIGLYFKFSVYLTHLLLFSIILASFHPQVFTHFFSAIVKFVPIPIINYFAEKNISHADVFYIFTVISTISGIAIIWNYFFPRNYIGKMLVGGKDMKNYPSFHMASIHNKSSELTTLSLLSIILFAQTNDTSFSTFKSLVLSLLMNAPFVFLFCCIGTARAMLECVVLIMSGFGTIINEKKDQLEK
ncbi:MULTISPECIES: hypothetical protein [Bacillus amyloliquefaciens group]|uniref:hypothetical protein n=1 Tax=Bacillus amyloliquefaciens group TaxID=1938374 RepID=UPI00077D8D48|nr:MULTISPECIES: hypothetical protein [Bacillus amyloliquefaciens group]AMQ72486.1 hypothetical protein BAMY6614_03655 [Bacillus amyloliquefaciens UMAF6614]AWM49997.1 hypothetical protein DDT09_19970 [Bacillus amyloliquefaciens]MBF6666397.1 hypothetical protein [Bacillus velezensis]WKW08896.1 hypothetical protein Q3Y59_19440 [Bacillus velezensis]